MNTSVKTAEQTAPTEANGEAQTWELRPYIAGQTPRSIAAFANLKRLCAEHLPGRASEIGRIR